MTASRLLRRLLASFLACAWPLCVAAAPAAPVAPPVHYLPSSSGFVEAAARRLGWCLAHPAQFTAAHQAGALVVIDQARWIDVPLYWQHAAVRSSTLQRVGQALREAAATALRS